VPELLAGAVDDVLELPVEEAAGAVDDVLESVGKGSAGMLTDVPELAAGVVNHVSGLVEGEVATDAPELGEEEAVAGTGDCVGSD
jgi:hypothetical protein